MSLGLLFPGQGSQHVGMGQDLAREFPEAARAFGQADEILGFSLSRLMWDGPEEELTLTHNAQPAILVHSYAVLQAYGAQLEGASLAAGHSLGEYSAHLAMGTLSFPDALVLVRLRGELMLEAGRARVGTMAAVLGLDDDAVETVCTEVSGGVCVPANFNTQGQVVISGDRPGVAEAMEGALRAGAKRVVELNVSGAFHSPLMESAQAGLSDRLATVPFSDPSCPVVSNVTAEPVRTGSEARDLLVRQITSPVRWSESIETMLRQGVDHFLEVGPGSVLCGLNKRNARGMPCSSLSKAADLLTHRGGS